MSEEPVNFKLEWKGEIGERRSQSAREEFSQFSEEAARAQVVVEEEPEPDLEAAPETFVEAPAAEPEAAPDESPEYFEWTAERERAIQRFLEAAPEGSLPTVHLQLSAIHQALKHGNLEASQAERLLDEVEGYLARHIALEERKVPVAHSEFLAARGEKLRAFSAYLEAAGALREFLAGGEAVHLDVSVYAADQGSAFLAGARQMLFEAEPLEEE